MIPNRMREVVQVMDNLFGLCAVANYIYGRIGSCPITRKNRTIGTPSHRKLSDNLGESDNRSTVASEVVR
ncbi:hypothetical protein C8U37_1212 [Trichococcus patagoniensis]|uniref:Uncharacterized protein n=1 Tax=Trichococcus patagoniensis TaxID=382641 RepID=A0A2T5ICM9_9LACT|nr:hypothetical protein C8U37_1212 [Trichococcus patagoniensis]